MARKRGPDDPRPARPTPAQQQAAALVFGTSSLLPATPEWRRPQMPRVGGATSAPSLEEALAVAQQPMRGDATAVRGSNLRADRARSKEIAQLGQEGINTGDIVDMLAANPVGALAGAARFSDAVDAIAEAAQIAPALFLDKDIGKALQHAGWASLSAGFMLLPGGQGKISREAAEEAARLVNKGSGNGFAIDLTTGKLIPEGAVTDDLFMVGGRVPTAKRQNVGQVTADDIVQLVTDQQKAGRRGKGSLYFGGWVDDNGVIHYDLNDGVKEADKAMDLARQRNEMAIFNLKDFSAPKNPNWRATPLGYGRPAEEHAEVIRRAAGDESADNFLKFMEGSQQRKAQFHSTFSDFDTFGRTSDIGYHTGEAKAAENRWRNVIDADEYHNNADHLGATMPLFGSFKKPLDLPDLGGWTPFDLGGALASRGMLGPEDLIRITDLEDLKGKDAAMNALREILEKRGYDSIRYVNEYEGPGSTSMIALRPQQLKSATGNRGTFDPTNPNILMGLGAGMLGTSMLSDDEDVHGGGLLAAGALGILPLNKSARDAAQRAIRKAGKALPGDSAFDIAKVAEDESSTLLRARPEAAPWTPTSRGVFDRNAPSVLDPDVAPAWDEGLRITGRQDVGPLTRVVHDSPVMEERLADAAQRGLPAGGRRWYETGGILDAFQRIGQPEQYVRFGNAGGAGSIRSSTTSELANAHILLRAADEGVPEEEIIRQVNAAAQNLGIGKVQFIPGTMPAAFRRTEAGLLVPYMPSGPGTGSLKVPYYTGGKFGHLGGRGVALDTHEGRDMAISVLMELGMPVTDRSVALVKDLLEKERKNPRAYLGQSAPYRRVGELLGIPSAEVQSGRWIGNGLVTGLKSQPFGDYMQTVEDMLYHNARARGMEGTPAELQDLFRLSFGKNPTEPIIPYHGVGGFKFD